MGRRITLLVEGKSERGDARRSTLPEYLKRWLEKRLQSPPGRRVGIEAIALGGVHHYLDDYAQKACDHLDRGSDYVIGLVDAREFPFSRLGINAGLSLHEKLTLAKNQLESATGANWARRFRQHFLIQELESLLLADDALWNPEQRQRIRNVANNPHSIKKAAELVAELHGSSVKKVIAALRLFPRSDLDNALGHHCPHLTAFANGLLAIGRELAERD